MALDERLGLEEEERLPEVLGHAVIAGLVVGERVGERDADPLLEGDTLGVEDRVPTSLKLREVEGERDPFTSGEEALGGMEREAARVALTGLEAVREVEEDWEGARTVDVAVKHRVGVAVDGVLGEGAWLREAIQVPL